MKQAKRARRRLPTLCQGVLCPKCGRIHFPGKLPARRPVPMCAECVAVVVDAAAGGGERAAAPSAAQERG
jgi:hypothetical protein